MTAKLTDTQRRALVLLSDKRWQGTAESWVQPNTAQALVERGLATERRNSDYRRLEWRLTDAGKQAQTQEIAR